MKYRPGFPARFGSIQDARAFCQQFFTWYNREHRHSGIAMMAPKSVHYGHDVQLHQARAQVLAGAYTATQSGSYASRPSRGPCPPRCGSTRPSRHRRRLRKQPGSASQKR
jgi:putative transposase